MKCWRISIFIDSDKKWIKHQFVFDPKDYGKIRDFLQKYNDKFYADQEAEVP